MQGHMKQDQVWVGGLQGLHFELFGIVNNKWNFNMELINTQSTKMIVCSFDSKRTFCVCQFLKFPPFSVMT
jgi:hypothetical protein